MSVPWRKPPSTKTGMRPPTAWTTSGRHSIVGRSVSVARPPWFETMMASAPCSTASRASSALSRPLSRSFMRESFFSRSTYSHVASGGFVRASLSPSYIGLWMRTPGLPGESRSGRGVASREEIDGPRDRRAPCIFHALDELFGVAPVPRHVELIPGRRAVGLRDVLDGGARRGRQDHLMALRSRRARGCELAFAEKRLLAADRTHEDRRFPFRAEDVDGQVRFRHVDESPGLE